MRILYLHHGYFPSLAGAEIMTYRLAGAMQRRGHDVQVVCQGSGDSLEQQHLEGIEVLKVPTLETALLHTLLEWQPDIVHAVDAVWSEYPQAALALAQKGEIPFAITPASAMSIWHDLSSTLAVCREANAVFVLTQTEREQFKQLGVPADRLIVTRLGPHLLGEPDPISFRRTHQISGPMVLFLGRKVAFKGYKLLLAATVEVWTQCPDTYFVFIGPPSDPDCLEVFAAFADPRIIEIGVVDQVDKHSALAACDLVCLPSAADVFPLVYLEAWTCGKPVIASHFPGIHEIVRHGQDGLITAAAPSAISAAIVDLLKDTEKRLAMGAMGLTHVREQFNWEVIAHRTEVVYLQLVCN